MKRALKLRQPKTAYFVKHSDPQKYIKPPHATMGETMLKLVIRGLAPLLCICVSRTGLPADD